MLNALRRQAGSWVVKALLLLLVVSFAVWGIGDVFFGSPPNPTVAKVGSSEIAASELSDAFNRSLNALQGRLGGNIDREQAIQLGMMQQALQELIARRLIDLRARDMGLTVADDTLRSLITEDPLFQTGGQFDRARFEQLLAANGMTEQSYLASLRQDLVRSTLTGGLTGPVAAPEALVDALYRYRNEERRGHLVRVTTDSITDLPEPSEEELAAYLEAHEQEFTTPQYRTLTFVTLTPEDLLDEVAIADGAIEAEYQARMASYRTPERRTVAQLLAPDQATIDKAAEQVEGGASFAEVAEQLAGEGVTADQLGAVTRSDLPAATGGGDLRARRGRGQRAGRDPVRLASVRGRGDRARGGRAARRGARRARPRAGAERGARAPAGVRGAARRRAGGGLEPRRGGCRGRPRGQDGDDRCPAATPPTARGPRACPSGRSSRASPSRPRRAR